MKWIQVQALAGSVALVLGASATWAQTDATGSSGQTGALTSGKASASESLKKATEGGMAKWHWPACGLKGQQQRREAVRPEDG